MQTVWREGDRIRRTDGTGYGDMVSDDLIRQHLAKHKASTPGFVGDPLFVPFAEAVLAVRAFERCSAVSDA